jgi:O-antigen/teichoic acid export membrane protein
MRTSVQAAMSAINLYSEHFLGLIISLTIARSLSPEEYGVYSSIIWLAGLFILAINSGLAINVTKFVAEFLKRDPESLPAIVAYFWRIQKIRVSIVFSLALIIFYLNFNQSYLGVWTLGVLLFCVIVKSDYMFRMAIFKGMKKYDVLAKTSLLANPFNICAVLVCAYIAPTLNNFILVYCGACLVYGISACFFYKELPENVWNNDVINEHKKRIIFQMISATGIVFLSSVVFKQSQVLVLEQSSFLKEAGFFNIGFLLSMSAMTLIPGVYQEILLPKITDAVQNGDVKQQVEQAERYLITLALLVAIPVVLYADVIIEVLYGEQYQEAAFALQVMIIIRALMTLIQGANLTLISNDKQVGMVKLNIMIFIIAAILSVIIVPKVGLNGALIVYGILVLLMLGSYSLLAKGCGYKMISIGSLARIIFPASISVIPVIIINQFASGIFATIIGSITFAILYLNLLFVFKGYDSSVSIILKQVKTKVPSFTQGYIDWCIRRLA